MPAGRRLLIALATAVVLAVAVGSLLGVEFSDDAGPSAGGDGSVGASQGEQDGRSPSGRQGGSESVGEPSTERGGSDTGEGGSAPAVPAGGARQDGVQVLSEAPGAGPGVGIPPGALRPPARIQPTWDELPARAAYARGRVVDGFPSSLLPVAPRGTVVSTSVSPSRGRVQVALVARRAQSAEAVLGFYRERLARAGFVETSSPAAGGSWAAAFRRAADRIVVTGEAGGSRTYSAFGSFHRGGA